MTMRFRIIPIHLSYHFIERWHERVTQDDPRKIVKVMRKIIESEVQKGAEVSRGVLQVPVYPGVYARVAPSLDGGWECITVISEVDNEDRHYREPWDREKHIGQETIREIAATNDQ